MNGFLALTWNGFREARRNKVTVVVAAFAAAVLLSTPLVMEITVTTFDRVLNDFGLGMMSLILAFLAVFLSCGLLSREIERRSIFLIVSKPFSRASFVLARWAGNLITLAVMLAIMHAVFALQLWALRSPLTAVQIVTSLGLFAELMLITSVGFFFSSISGPMVSAVATLGVYLAGHLSSDLHSLSQASLSPVLKTGGKVLYYLLPDLGRVNFRPQAAYDVAVSANDFLMGVLHVGAWSAILVTLSIVFFNRRDFR